LLSLAGIPLTAGFIGKFYIFTSAAEGRLWGLLLATIVGSGLGLYYYLRIIVVMSMNAEATAIKTAQGWISTTLLAVLTILLVWIGCYPSLLVNVIQAVSYEMEWGL